MGDELEQLDWLDRKLREEAPYIDDAGFTRTVMQKLPARRATRSLRALIILLSAVVGSVAVYVLSGGGGFVYELLARAELFSPVTIIIAAAVLSLCFTTAAALAVYRRAEI